MLSPPVMSDSLVTSWTAACQAPLFMEFPGQEHWSRLTFLPPINSVCVCVCMCELSHVWLFGTPWTELLGSSGHGIFQARILEWLPLLTPGNLPNPGIETEFVSCIGRWILYQLCHLEVGRCFSSPFLKLSSKLLLWFIQSLYYLKFWTYLMKHNSKGKWFSPAWLIQRKGVI